MKAKPTTKFLATLCMLCIVSISSLGQNSAIMKLTPSSKGYAPVNGLKMYYEIYGTGDPLVLIHGGVGAIEMFIPILPSLSQNHKVIAVDLQAHGRTADIDRPLSYESMAEDIFQLLKYLKIEKADIMGYSLGGGVALQTAIKHPEAVRKLVLVSAPCKSDGWYADVRTQMKQSGPASAEQMKQTPLYQLYSSIAPKPEDWPVLFTKLGQMLSKEYDWSDDVKKMKIPTMIVAGDADAMRTAHAVEFFNLLGGAQHDAGWDGSARPSSQLAILPGLTHYTIFASPSLVSTIIPFLDKP